MLPALALSLALLISMASPGQAMPAPSESQGCWEHPMLTGSDLPDPLPVGAAVPCPGIRPGAYVLINDITGCTLNFVFRGTSYDEEGRPIDEGLFIGTAGHCVLPDEGDEQTWAPGTGPVAKDASGQRFGEAAYGVLKDPTQGESMNVDFALFRIDDNREAEVNPAVCHFGGPTGTSITWDRGDIVHHFGYGLVYGNTVQARSGVVDYPQGEGSAIIFNGAVLFGDSGSPLIESDGDALGVVTAILPPLVFSTPIGMQVERAEGQLDMQLELVEAPFV
jgi:trypsin-like peptidase